MTDRGRAGAAAGATLALALWVGYAGAQAPGGVAGIPARDTAALQSRFTADVWPWLKTSCLPCHGQKNASQFVLPRDPKAAFLLLAGEGHFDDENHASALWRITTTDKNIVMPPAASGKLPAPQIAAFDRFAESVRARQTAGGARPDESFPAHLNGPFGGARKPGGGNTFLTLRQLKGKVLTLFGDDWVRGDRDLFVENAALFGGADFVKRFDETRTASPTFLDGIERLSRDVATRAYLNRTGPFAGMNLDLPAPGPAWRPAIDRLWEGVLLRKPTDAERSRALNLARAIWRDADALAKTPSELRFALTVTDDAGRSASTEVALGLRADGRGLTARRVDQSETPEGDAGPTGTASLGVFTLAPRDPLQQAIVSNEGTYGNVSVVGVALKPADGGAETLLKVDSPAVTVEGAWQTRTDGGLISAEDGNDNKGASRIVFPLNPPTAGRYEVRLVWRRLRAPAPGARRGRNRAPSLAAENVPVEIVSRDLQSHLDLPPAPPLPPPGEAHFTIDQSIDNRPHAELKTAFVFGADGAVEVRNDRTSKRVVADAVRLFPTQGETLLLLGKDAAGKEAWKPFPRESFNPYNTVGPDLFQDLPAEGGAKEPMGLRFRPAGVAGYDPKGYYTVGVVYPGKADNETRVPIVVHAQASAPIVRVRQPLRAAVGAEVTLDAAPTYNLQRSPLRFRWTQIGGPRVALSDPNAAQIRFVARSMTPQQAAWEGLCRALVSHPDFLFTRARTLAQIADPVQRRRLQLMKIALDLVGRAPTRAELALADKGAPLATLVDRYLAGPEFADFYFHRTRLYVESHGTPEQDEPARLWTWIATHDRPFQEILTADYTVDTAWRKASRPAYHGKTGVLTMRGFLEGKPSLPHFNYSAQVCEKFLGYVFEVPDEIVQARQGITASGTTDPNSVCYTCHKVLTPLAFQRQHFDDLGNFRTHDETGMAIDASDQGLAAGYPFAGEGMEAFAVQAARKERFVRTILQTHFVWYFGREMRCEGDERGLYRRLWDASAKAGYRIRPLIRALVLSPEYLTGAAFTPPPTRPRPDRRARLTAWHGGLRRSP